MSDTNCQMLRELFSKYKSSDNMSDRQKIFEKILMRVDRLLIYTINKYIKTDPQLSKVEDEDLYNTAILGLYRAINTSKNNEPGVRLIARIIGYVRKEIHKTYLYMTNEGEMKRISFEKIERELADGREHRNIEDVEEHEVWDKIMDKMLNPPDVTTSRQDFNMLVDHSINDSTYSEIGKRQNLSRRTVSKRIKRASRKLRDGIGGV